MKDTTKNHESTSVISYRKRIFQKSGRSLKTILISGVGFLADAYDLFVIDFVVAILSKTAMRIPTATEKSMIVSTTHAGAVLGQICFGVGADFIGRRAMFITTAILIIFGSLISSIVGIGYTTSDPTFNVFIQLALCRFFLGFGIGGEYPLSATVTSESDDDRGESSESRSGFLWYLTHKPNSIAVVFSMQGLGMLLSPLFVFIFLKMGVSLEYTWRICLALGAIPSVIAFYFRWKMHETVAFKNAQREYSFAESVTTGITSQSDKRFHRQDGFVNSFEIDKSKQAPVFSPDSLDNTKNKAAENIFTAGTSHNQLPSKYPLEDDYMSIFNQNDSNETPVITNDSNCVLNNQEKRHSATKNANKKKEDGANSVILPFKITKAQSHETVIKPTFYSFLRHLQYVWAILKQHKTLLLASSVTWFLIDITLYGTGSFKSAIVTAWFPSDIKEETTKNTVDYVVLQAKFGAYIALIAIPGYILSVLFIHKTGTRKLQIYGFVAIGIVFIVLGITELNDFRDETVQLILFGLTFLASNFGPNTTTFILPTQLYPTLVRATCHGFSAAMGKLGGMVGTACFPFLLKGAGMGWVLVCCGIVAFLGVPFSVILPKDESVKERLEQAEKQSIDIAYKRNAQQQTEV